MDRRGGCWIFVSFKTFLEREVKNVMVWWFQKKKEGSGLLTANISSWRCVSEEMQFLLEKKYIVSSFELCSGILTL